MMDIGGDNPVTLIVKAPNQRIADQTVDCFLEWTVRKLKEHLQDVYPSNPNQNHQKLIYSGKLLQDHVTLKEVLRQRDEASLHTVHLVCSDLFLSESNTDLPTESVSSSSATPLNSSEGLRHRGSFMPGMEQYQFGHSPMSPPQMPPGYGYSPEQFMWMQQMYAQYMTQYMQYYNNVYQTPTTPAAPQPAPEAQGANQNQRNNAPAAQAANPNMRMNAQGGMVEDDDEEDLEHRDWLDYIYIMFRFLVLLSIVYFYSTISRFVAVCAGFFLIYLLQKGWFNLGRNRPVQRAQPAPEPEREPVPEQEPEPEREPQTQPPQEQQEVQENQETNETSAESVETNSNEQPTTPVESRPGFMATAWCFFSTFITSLIPQQPPAVNAN